MGYRERLGRPQPAWLQRCCRSAQKAGGVVPSPAHGCCAPRGGQPSPDAPFSNLLRCGGPEVGEKRAPSPSTCQTRPVRSAPSLRPLPSRAGPRRGTAASWGPALSSLPRVVHPEEAQTPRPESRLGPRALAAPGKAAAPGGPPPLTPFPAPHPIPAASSGSVRGRASARSPQARAGGQSLTEPGSAPQAGLRPPRPRARAPGTWPPLPRLRAALSHPPPARRSRLRAHPRRFLPGPASPARLLIATGGGGNIVEWSLDAAGPSGSSPHGASGGCRRGGGAAPLPADSSAHGRRPAGSGRWRGS